MAQIRRAETEYVKDAYEALNYFGDENRAIHYLDEQLKVNPKDADALFLRAIINRKQGLKGKALDDITLAAKYNKRNSRQNDAVIYWWMATIKGDMGDQAGSLEAMKKAYDLTKKKYPQNYHDIAIGYATNLFFVGRTSDADMIFREVLEVYPNDSKATMGLVKNKIMDGGYDEALDLLVKYQQYNPTDAESYQYLMMIYGKKGSDYDASDAALEYLKRVGLSSWDVVEPYFQKTYDYSVAKLKSLANELKDRDELDQRVAVLHYKARKYSKAIDMFTALDEKHVLDYGINRSYLAESLAAIGLYENAIKTISECIDSLPAAAFYSNRASYYRASGEYDKALVDCDVAIETLPEEPYLYFSKGLTYERSGNSDEALQCYNECINIDPKMTFSYSRLARGRLYLERGDSLRANKDFESVIKGELFTNEESCKHIALLYTGEEDAAIKWVDSIIELYPDSASAYYDKACIYSYFGDTDSALEAIARSIELGYNDLDQISRDNLLDNIRETEPFITICKKLDNQVLSEQKKYIHL